MKKDDFREMKHSETDKDLFMDDKDIEEGFFAEEDEEEGLDHPPFVQRQWVKRAIAIIFSVALVANVLAFWPQVYSLAAIQFLVKSRELSQNAAIQEYKQAVVTIRSGDSKGTGFNITADGLIITNEHVVKGSAQTMVYFANGQSYVGEVIASDPELDIAILDLEATGLPTLDLAESAVGATDEPIYVIGNPLFFNHIANEGHALGVYTDETQSLMVIDAPIYRGNSGSPVINKQGEVIGVVFATTRMPIDGDSQKVGLAVPITEVHRYVQEQVR